MTYHVYQEWLSSNYAWKLQVSTMFFVIIKGSNSSQSQLPAGVTLLGVILSSDKTHVMTIGNCKAHSLLISLTNISSDICNKAQNNASMLLALLSIPKFTHSNKHLQGMLTDRLLHCSISIVIDPLKKTAQYGQMMSNPVGNSKYCFTLLAAHIADVPKAHVLSYVCNNTSHVTTATKKTIWGPFSTSNVHCPGNTIWAEDNHHKDLTIRPHRVLQSLQSVPRWCKQAMLGRLALHQTCHFILSQVTPPLVEIHQWPWPQVDYQPHWCQWAWLSILITPTSQGLLTLSKWCHHSHILFQMRPLECSVLPHYCWSHAPQMPPGFMCTHQFPLLCSGPHFQDSDITRVEHALQEFHENSSSIIKVQACSGKHVIEHWEIPKLELMQSVRTSIWLQGTPMQWTAEVMEWAHVHLMKEPAHSGNNHDLHSQICHYLECIKKYFLFNQATSLSQADHSGSGSDDDDNCNCNNNDSSDNNTTNLDPYQHGVT